MKCDKDEAKGPHLRVKDLKELLKNVPDNAFLYFPSAGTRIRCGHITITIDRHTRPLQEGEAGYFHGLVNETYDESRDPDVCVGLNIANPLEYMGRKG
jgi:hypothetical protein